MKRKIWITKDWKLSACIMIWFEKPRWYPNKKHSENEKSGYWGDQEGHLTGHPLSHDAFRNLFGVSFHKKTGEGFVAERIISVNKAKVRSK